MADIIQFLKQEDGKMNFMEPQDWTFPTPIAYGPGRLKEIAAMCSDAGMSKPLIVTDRGSRDLPFIADVGQYLKAGGISSNVYAGISPNPRENEIATGCETFRKDDHDGIIAIGGGSGMDGGKAICMVATSGFDLWDFEFSKTPPDMAGHPPFPPLICVPTTAGTGAETESTGMVTEMERKMKFCIWHPELRPTLAILDPEITIGLPANLTAWTGADALVHAIEAYCVPDFHPMCDGIALEALRLISAWLPKAVSEPENIEARGAMLVGSCLAGISFLKGLGLVHAVGHAVGGEYDTHHGLAMGIIMPAVLRFNEPAITEKIGPMAEAMGLEDKSFEGLYSGVCALLDNLNIPKNLTEIDVPANCAAAVSERTFLDGAVETNPKQPTVKDMRAIVEEALSNGR
jgi:alcohol dehydrogenase class IV